MDSDGKAWALHPWHPFLIACGSISRGKCFRKTPNGVGRHGKAATASGTVEFVYDEDSIGLIPGRIEAARSARALG